MPVKVNVDNFSIGPKERTEQWEKIRRYPNAYAENRTQWFHYAESQTVPDFPLHVDFETSSTCNMNCPMCWRNRNDYNPDNFGVMDFDLFKKGLDECASENLYSIRLSWRGECTTNPHLLDMIRYAKNAGIKEVSFISNGYAIEGDYAEELVKTGVDYITVSVDDIDDAYNSIRHPSTYEGVLERLKNLRHLRDTIGDGFPRLRVNGVWAEEKTEAWFEKMYKALGNIVDYITYTPEYAQDGKEKKLRDKFVCQYLFQRVSIMWDGTVPLCISDKGKEYIVGNLHESSIRDIWHGERFKNARNLHTAFKAHEIKCCACCDRAVTKQVGNKLA